MRLIDADGLRKQFEDREFMDFTNLHFIEAIDNAPTVELQIGRMTNGIIIPIERSTGEWLEDSGNIACSNCHTIWLYRRTNYCPNCGVRMKGEKNEID